MINNNSNLKPDKNEVRDKDEAIKKLKKDRLKIKQESESFAWKITANSTKSK